MDKGLESPKGVCSSSFCTSANVTWVSFHNFLGSFLPFNCKTAYVNRWLNGLMRLLLSLCTEEQRL